MKLHDSKLKMANVSKIPPCSVSNIYLFSGILIFLCVLFHIYISAASALNVYSGRSYHQIKMNQIVVNSANTHSPAGLFVVRNNALPVPTVFNSKAKQKLQSDRFE